MSDDPILPLFSQHVVTVDPGLGGIGVAVWDASKWQKELSAPIYCVNLHSTRRYETLVARLGCLIHRFQTEIIEKYSVIQIVVEMPQFMGDGAGRGSIAAKEGDLVKLCLITGALMGLAQTRQIPLAYKDVRAWKGQMPKHVIEGIVKEVLPGWEGKSHSIDACALGLEVQGFLTRNKHA